MRKGEIRERTSERDSKGRNKTVTNNQEEIVETERKMVQRGYINSNGIAY